jgi:hypothetical protein
MGARNDRQSGPGLLREEQHLRSALELAAAVLGLIAGLYVLGLIVTWVRLGAARLPTGLATTALTNLQLFGTGLQSTALTLTAFALLCGLAYVTSAFRWEINGQDWHDIVRKRGVGRAKADSTAPERHARREDAAALRKSQMRLTRSTKVAAVAHLRGDSWLENVANRRVATHLSRLDALPGGLDPAAPAAQAPGSAALGDGAVRIIAGFNLMMIAGLTSLIPARLFQAAIPPAWLAAVGSGAFIGAWVVSFLALHQLLTRINPLRFGPRVHGLPWVVIGIAALLASAPIGVLVLTGVAISTFGRVIARAVPRPRSLIQLIRSPLPWILVGIVAILSLAYNAMPPVTFPSAVITTPGGRLAGGYLNRTAQGVYLVTCTPLADATSTSEQVRFVRTADAGAVAVNGIAFSLDSGERASLITLALHAVSVNGVLHPLFHPDLRPQRLTCGGANPSKLTHAVEDPGLGAGVLVPPPGTAVTRAHDGEPPIQQQTVPAPVPAPIVALARRYQPTLLVTAADRFWPVSVNALLADRGPHGGPTCLMQHRTQPVCGAKLSAESLGGSGALGSDYLQFPVRLTHDPNGFGQLRAFQNGQYTNPGSLHQWLADPGRLHPWYTAQIYFYLGHRVSFASFPTPRTTWPDPNASQTFVPLEYWFYYPYNYFPLLTDAQLMDQAPIAGDKLNVDLHQGDWEHIDVLLNSVTLAPEWLYMARHSNEGQFIQWGSPSLALDDGHPLVQAAFGGHPTYQPGCGAQVRNQPAYVLVDWLVCGSGRFAFRAATTPLVDIAGQPWACWPGHFGAAGTRDEIKSVGRNESVLDSVRGQIFVAGPQAPVAQAENRGTCHGGALAPEKMAMTRYFPPARRPLVKPKRR